MSSHPLKLALHFVLEVVGLVAIGYWGWAEKDGIWRPVLCVGLPVIAAVLWGTFRVPDDPGKAPVTVRGYVRLALEIAYFALGVALLAAADQPTLALILAVMVVLDYAAGYDRIRWLLTER